MSITTPATPLSEAQLWRVFYAQKENIHVEYQKPPLTYDEQLDLLIGRGLKVNSRADILGYLRNISYYRLSAYHLPFKQGENFKPETCFEEYY